MKEARIIETGRKDYPYNVQIFIEGCYSGRGNFCKTYEEARDYAEAETR